MLVTSQTFIQKVSILAGSLFYICLENIFAQQNSLLSSSMKLGSGHYHCWISHLKNLQNDYTTYSCTTRHKKIHILILPNLILNDHVLNKCTYFRDKNVNCDFIIVRWMVCLETVPEVETPKQAVAWLVVCTVFTFFNLKIVPEIHWSGFSSARSSIVSNAVNSGLSQDVSEKSIQSAQWHRYRTTWIHSQNTTWLKTRPYVPFNSLYQTDDNGRQMYPIRIPNAPREIVSSQTDEVGFLTNRIDQPDRGKLDQGKIKLAHVSSGCQV